VVWYVTLRALAGNAGAPRTQPRSSRRLLHGAYPGAAGPPPFAAHTRRAPARSHLFPPPGCRLVFHTWGCELGLCSMDAYSVVSACSTPGVCLQRTHRGRECARKHRDACTACGAARSARHARACAAAAPWPSCTATPTAAWLSPTLLACPRAPRRCGTPPRRWPASPSSRWPASSSRQLRGCVGVGVRWGG
jgi:hypothetical protein